MMHAGHHDIPSLLARADFFDSDKLAPPGCPPRAHAYTPCASRPLCIKSPVHQVPVHHVPVPPARDQRASARPPSFRRAAVGTRQNALPLLAAAA